MEFLIRRGGILVCLALLGPGRTLAQDKNYFFYHDLPYGSEALYNPVTLVMNGTLDVLQNYSVQSRLSDIAWRVGATNVWRNITSPFPIINQYGWNNFLKHEVFPTSLDYRNAQFVPNYLLHAVGGGMEFRKIWEWYDAHGYPVPQLFAGLTTYGFEFLNETVENGNAYFPTTDPIADMLIFNPLGIILFSFDPVCSFFSSGLSLNDWSGQMAISLSPFTVYNFGQTFVAKVPVVPAKGTSAFFLLGETALLGVSQKFDSSNALSLGLGATHLELFTVDVTNGIQTKSVKMGFVGGVYYDRDNSLLASLLVGNGLVEKVRLNVYPGLWEYGGFAPGLFAFLDKQGHPTVGITVRWLPFGLTIQH